MEFEKISMSRKRAAETVIRTGKRGRVSKKYPCGTCSEECHSDTILCGTCIIRQAYI